MDISVLEHLRHIRGTVDTLEKQYGVTQIAEAGQNIKIEHLKDCIDRVEHRLDLRD